MQKIQQNMTADLTAIPDEDFQRYFGNGRTAGASVYVQKGRPSKVSRLVYITYLSYSQLCLNSRNFLILLQYTYTLFSSLNCYVTCPFKHKRNCGGVIRASNGKQGWQEECTATYKNHESAMEHYT